MLIGVNGNPLNFLSTQGYATLGLPGNMTPGSANAASPTNNFVNTEFGAAWHSDGAILRGMQASTQVGHARQRQRLRASRRAPRTTPATTRTTRCTASTASAPTASC